MRTTTGTTLATAASVLLALTLSACGKHADEEHAPGMTVLDMYSGGGYYAEILSHLVGESGRVIAQSNEAYLQFVGDEFENRYLGGRLSNAQVLMAENNELELVPNSLDAVMLVLSFHDLFYAAPESGWPAIDVPAFLAELDGQSDILRNPEDDYEKVVFDPEVRGKTDRFVMRFRKPE